MQVKLLEVRDSATFLPVLAVKTLPENEEQRYLLARCGYGRFAEHQAEYVLLARLSAAGLPICYDPYRWDDRTLATAHQYILENWNTLHDGDVVDVEYILGERKVPKLSERLACVGE